MKTQVTFGHILTILAIIIIPLFVWGVNVETRFEKVISNKEDINKIKTDAKENQKSNQENFDKVLEKLHGIELQLTEKADR